MVRGRVRRITSTNGQFRDVEPFNAFKATILYSPRFRARLAPDNRVKLRRRETTQPVILCVATRSHRRVMQQLLRCQNVARAGPDSGTHATLTAPLFALTLPLQPARRCATLHARIKAGDSIAALQFRHECAVREDFVRHSRSS